MNGKPLDAIGVTGEGGKAVLLPAAPIFHATVEPQKRREPESEAEYCREKIAELVLTQSQLGKAIAERDALAQELQEIKRVAQTYNQPDRKDSWKWLNKVGDIAATALARLEAGEFRKLRTPKD